MLFNKEQNKTVIEYVNTINREKTWANDDLVLDDHYVFNRAYYEEIIPILKDLHQKFILNTAVIIPFDLPFDEKTYSYGRMYHPDNKCLITFIFSRVTEKRNIYAGFIERMKCEYLKAITRCEMIFTFEEPLIESKQTYIDINDLMELVSNSKHSRTSDEDFTNATFHVFNAIEILRDDALFLLNNLIISYGMLSGDRTVRTITAGDIEFISHFRGIRINDWKTYNWLFLNNTEKFSEERKKVISNDLFAHCIGLSSSFKSYQFSNFQANMLNAQYEILNGNKVNSIVLLVTTIQTLLQSIITLFWENEEKISSHDADNRIEDVPFIKMFTTWMPQIIGGIWNKKNQNSVFGEWYASCYEVRNDIIHNGTFYKGTVLDKAIMSSFKLIEYIINRMCSCRYGYLKDIKIVPNITIKDMSNGDNSPTNDKNGDEK
ncbi:hypothetical protein [Sediminispirochaeta bajacaliforniensis]|uniref:hypothetical protein n=1 Tax=Sediminispirochaeta bajacaliforniensis TaxID=148 RepID=UPI00036BAC4B|nr:hypothetical protein [Sediminispirochaeta bajacaliforniensis]